MKNLPVLMAAIRQRMLDGELTLEQNDGTRRLYFNRGELVHLQSDVAGEQFGNYLLRQGILDFPALSELLANDEQYRLGEKVVQWGMMTVQERDCHLLSMQEQVMIHALEHAIIASAWNPGSMAVRLSQDLHFQLEHRHFIWNTFQEAHDLTALSDLLYAERDWKWEGRFNLLETVADLPLTPTTAYAISFLGSEPVSFETFLSLSHLPEADAARLLITLWVLGVLTLPAEQLPGVVVPVPEPLPVPIPFTPATPLQPLGNLAFTPLPPLLPTPSTPLPPLPTPSSQLPPLELNAFDSLRLDPLPPGEQLEFLDPESRTLPAPPAPPAPAPPTSESAERAKKLVIKAKLLIIQDRTVEAIRCLEQSVQLEPEQSSAFEAWLLLGRLRMANPAWSTRSIDALQTASRLQPKAAEPWASMGEVYYRKSFRSNAVACFQRALELDPSVPIPPDVDLQEVLARSHPSAANASMFTRFKALLGGTEKP